MQGDKGRERHIRCNAFCTFLAGKPELVWAFNSLPHVHQIFTLLLHEPWEDRPHLFKEQFLQAMELQQHTVWQATTSKDGVMDAIQRESRLRHMEEFFRERGHYGVLERMRPACPESMCPERREKQRLESDLYGMTKQLKREPLSIGDIKDFKA